MKNFLAFLPFLVLAFGSFGFARHHYVEIHSVALANPFRTSQTARLAGPFMHSDLLSGWVKDEWVFALAVPAGLIFGGMALTTRKQSNGQ